MLVRTPRLARLIVKITSPFQLLVLVAAPMTALGQGGAPVPPPPPFTSPAIQPTFADWLTATPVALATKIRLTDPLLKPPFAAAPPGSLKGMAAGIRAVQLDVPNRVKAVQYLGTVDCVTYPQAQDMLIATMQEDPSEIVRYEAVMALRNMLTRGCCNVDSQCECPTCNNMKKVIRQTERHARKGQRALIKEAKCHAKIAAIKAKHNAEAEDQRYDCCRGCQNEKAMKALAKVAFEKDDQCCFVEPSERVREAAAEAMGLFRNYGNGYMLPEDLNPQPVPGVESVPGEVEPPKDMEVAPQKDGEAPPEAPVEKKSDYSASAAPRLNKNASAVTVGPRVIQTQTVQPVQSSETVQPEAPQASVVPGLRGRCIVALKSRQIRPVDPRFASVFEERTYYFSSAEAKAAFDQNPRDFAPAYGGVDPVIWLAERQMCDGQYLREYNGQFFMFASKENWETFKGNPNRYVLRTREASIQTASNRE